MEVRGTQQKQQRERLDVNVNLLSKKLKIVCNEFQKFLCSLKRTSIFYNFSPVEKYHC